VTIKTLLAQSVESLEKMTDSELQTYLAPFVAVVENIRPVGKSKPIDVSNIDGKPMQVTFENADEFIKQMQAKMASRLGGIV
jgi:hypothetical protein